MQVLHSTHHNIHLLHNNLKPAFEIYWHMQWISNIIIPNILYLIYNFIKIIVRSHACCWGLKIEVKAKIKNWYNYLAPPSRIQKRKKQKHKNGAVTKTLQATRNSKWQFLPQIWPSGYPKRMVLPVHTCKDKQWHNKLQQKQCAGSVSKIINVAV